jgi:hypothetical protein
MEGVKIAADAAKAAGDETAKAVDDLLKERKRRTMRSLSSPSSCKAIWRGRAILRAAHPDGGRIRRRVDRLKEALTPVAEQCTL